MTRMPSAVTLSAAQNFLIEKSAIAHVGEGALSIENGSSGNTVSANRFEDVSGCGLQIGDLFDLVGRYAGVAQRTIKQRRREERRDRSGGRVPRRGGDFRGSFAENTSITHNEVFSTSYTGISVGWGGWNADYDFGGDGSHAGPTYARGNQIVGNLIHDVVQFLIDGGGVYTQGPQRQTR